MGGPGSGRKSEGKTMMKKGTKMVMVKEGGDSFWKNAEVPKKAVPLRYYKKKK